MKKITLITLLFLTGLSNNTFAQEKFGNTFNLGFGVGYYNYVGQPLPVIMLNYEFDVVRNFTLAPFVGAYTSARKYRYDKQDYYYRETVVPVGGKGTYYFDELFKASNKWDFYVAGSLGYSFVFGAWDNGYLGDKNYYRNARPVYADVHVGAEFHVSENFGIFLDLSSGVSTFGLAFH